MIIPWPTYYPQFPPKLSRLSSVQESVYRRLQGERSFIKTLPIRVRIFDVCQEQLTGFDLKALKPPNDHDHQKHWTFSVKTLNFDMRIDNILLRPFILSRKRRYWMSPPEWVRLSPSTRTQSAFYKSQFAICKTRTQSAFSRSSPVGSSPIRLLQHAVTNGSCL
jgi:hypothetical protein